MPDQIRILLCDDHTVVRAGLRRVLESHDDLTVVGEAGDGEQAVALAGDLQPDVVVMDLGLPAMSGIDATGRVLEASPRSVVLVLTVHDDVGYLRQAFDAGATGYLVKDAADTELVTAVRAVAAGEEHVHPRLGAALMHSESAPGPLSGPGGHLSERETEVLHLIALGLTNAQIAEKLFLSVRTVESHRSHITQKLNMRSRADLVAFAREAGLLTDDLI